jgi:vesicular inhibitory amino acid transporter
MDSDPLIRSYPDIGERAFGYKGRTLVSIFMYLELYLVAVEFLILEGDNLDRLFPNTGVKFAGLYIGGKTAFVLLTALVILPTTWLKSLGMLAYVSAGGVMASVLLVGCVLWVGAVDGVGFHENGVLLNGGGLPTTLSLFTFCYCGHAVFPTLCNSMKDRSQFSKVGSYVETESSYNWLSVNATMLMMISFQFKIIRVLCAYDLSLLHSLPRRFYLSALLQAPSLMDQWQF